MRDLLWAKRTPDGAWHSLVDHSADVSAVLAAILDLPLLRKRLSALGAAEALDSPAARSRLAALAFLHDIGKANRGFPARSDPAARIVGHIDELAWVFSESRGAERVCAGLIEVLGLWADTKGGRMRVARRMYALRLGEVLPHRDIAVLRGIEGARVKEIYRQAAERHGIRWDGRRYDRQNPGAADIPNQALNHAASAVEGAAAIAVAATATIPQHGFVHEDSGQSFVLDIADLFRDTVTAPCAFKAAKAHEKRPFDPVERLARRTVAERLRRDGVIPP
ncbi:HD domain-containing protein [Enterovirga aerilata]|uniref:HD domain-containing protein n=1 Tax=Enterovirga aerilata TaxID=2730920 RepID=UPI001AEE7B66|nr:HD domain-containing protein [Enterovirga sp. DB1703]